MLGADGGRREPGYRIPPGYRPTETLPPPPRASLTLAEFPEPALTPGAQPLDHRPVDAGYALFMAGRPSSQSSADPAHGPVLSMIERAVATIAVMSTAMHQPPRTSVFS